MKRESGVRELSHKKYKKGAGICFTFEVFRTPPTLYVHSQDPLRDFI